MDIMKIMDSQDITLRKRDIVYAPFKAFAGVFVIMTLFYHFIFTKPYKVYREVWPKKRQRRKKPKGEPGLIWCMTALTILIILIVIDNIQENIRSVMASVSRTIQDNPKAWIGIALTITVTTACIIVSSILFSITAITITAAVVILIFSEGIANGLSNGPHNR